MAKTNTEEYVILMGGDPSSLTSAVNNLLDQGTDERGLRWQPQGGVTITAVKEEDGEMTQWAQAMVKQSQ